jgi:hypothetical protein
MEQTRRPVSYTKVILLWVIMIGNLAFWIWFWGFRGRSAAEPPQQFAPADRIAQAIFSVFLSALSIGIGALAYFIVLWTNCFTFDFQKSFLRAYKGKLYLAKIVVPVLIAVGIGLLLSVPISPLLQGFGLDLQLAYLLPVLGVVVILQIVQLMVFIWTPLTRKLITKRLIARGVSLEQLQAATAYVGISDPTRSSFKKLTIVEDDMGALWITPQQLIYWGDSEEFSVTPEQLVQLERRADAGSSSMLGAMAHVILHTRTATGEIRQVRLHVEGEWTMFTMRRRMDQLAELIAKWHASAALVTGSRT